MSTWSHDRLEENFRYVAKRRAQMYAGIVSKKKKVEKLDALIADWIERLAIAEAGYAQMDRHAQVQFRKQKISRARGKVRRRRMYAADAVAAREQLSLLEARRAREQERLERLRLFYENLARRYYLARHHFMKSLAELVPDPRLPEFVDLAQVPSKYREGIGKIWHYTVQDDGVETVHLFWGGELSPTGEGWSPDGLGHAHYVLELSGSESRLVYARDVLRSRYVVIEAVGQSEAITA